MKKSLLVLSSLALVFSVAFTACGNKNNFVDKDGNSHVAVTEKNGNLKQNEMGDLYEIIEGDGTTATQLVKFPEAMTNKAQTWLENGTVHMKVPKGWRVSGIGRQSVIKHSGKCTKTGTSDCQIEFKYNSMRTIDQVMEKYLEPVRWLVLKSGECSDLKEYDIDLLGLKAKAVSYKFDKTGVTSYCYFLQQAVPVIQIEIYAYKDCYTEQELIELLNKNCTLKDLGGEIPTTTTTTTVAE